MSHKFSIRILSQGWLSGDSEHDLCSHGRIALSIGGQQVVAGEEHPEDEWSYGISEAGLALLRTLRCRHTPEHPVAERLIPHGCGTMLMSGCPIGIDWSVRHVSNTVRISGVVRYDATDESKAVRFPGIDLSIPWSDYAAEIVRFTTTAKSLFECVEKETSDEMFPGEYEAFWTEYDALLQNWDAQSERDLICGQIYLSCHS